MLFEITAGYTLNGVRCLNRWNYLGSGTPAAVTPSYALADAFGGVSVDDLPPANTVMSALRTLLSTAVAFDDITVNNIYDLDDFYSTPMPYNGVTTGNFLSPMTAYGFRTSRVTRAIGRGMKRFAGVSVGAIGNGGAIIGTGMTNAVALATRMGATLSYNDEGNTLTFVPVVVKKQEYTPDPAKPERKAYRYYPTLEAQLEHIAQGFVWEVYPTVRGQQSRQYGNGQ